MLTMSTTPRKPGRPATGHKAPSEYLADSKAALIASGGRRLNTNLSPEATAALDKIRARDAHRTDRAALEAALLAHANRRKR